MELDIAYRPCDSAVDVLSNAFCVCYPKKLRPFHSDEMLKICFPLQSFLDVDYYSLPF